MNRKKVGLLAVAFVVVVGAMEVLALRLGSFDFPDPEKKPRPAVAENP
ncbi:hypothetical protein [Actinomadura roseirufa]|nr:hypothetical protein [Actinomadura roseirufa]